MPDPNISLSQLFNAGEENRRLLHNVIEAVQLDCGVSFVDALDRVYEAAGWAIDGGDATVGGLLKSLGATGEAAVMDGLKLLEQRDAAVRTAERQPAKVSKLRRDPFGRVLLAQSYKGRPNSLGADGQLLDEREFEKRLARARTLDASYADDAGREQFRFEDDAHLRGGVDMVKTLEVAHEEQGARAQAGLVARQLDQAITAGNKRRLQVRKLDEQVAELTDQRREMMVPTPADAQAVKLLDEAKPKSGAVSVSRVPLSGPRTDEVRLLDQGAQKIDKRARKRLRRLGLPETSPNLIMALDAEARGEPMPEKTAAAQPAAPAGVHPASHAMHERITERMKLLDCGYQQALEQILSEE